MRFGRVTGTFSRRIPSTTVTGVNWVHLDIRSQESVEHLLEVCPAERLSAVYYFPGYLMESPTTPPSLDDLTESLQVNVGGLIQVFERMASRVPPGCRMVGISSRSALKPSFDVTYAAGKAAQLGAARSLATKFPQVCFYLVAPTTIRDSRMFLSMPEVVRMRHEQRLRGDMLSPADFADVLLTLDELSDDDLRNRLFTVGVEEEP